MLRRKTASSLWEPVADVRPVGTEQAPPPPPPQGLAADPDATLYDIPTAPPYNTPTRIVTPTYDGSGEAIHPSVIDFHQRIGTDWHGWRYWMLMTPYTNAKAAVENPSVLVSNNGFYWQVPEGLTNPLYWPAPGGSGAVLSDTHVEYDPTNDRLVGVFRDNGRNYVHLITESPDGTTWPAAAIDQDVPVPDGEEQHLSPSLVRVADDDWRMFGILKTTRRIVVYYATDPYGPWDGPYATVGADPSWSWHMDVQYHDGIFTLFVDRGPISYPEGYSVASSTDGLLWKRGSSNVIMDITDGWDSRQLYRAAHTPHENGTHYRVWYSASRMVDIATHTSEWGIGYTHLPASLWPTPPVATPGTGTAYRDLALSHPPAIMWRLGGDVLNPAPEPDLTGNGRTGTYSGDYVRDSSITGDAGYSSYLYGGRVWRAHEAWMAASALTVRAVAYVRSVSGVRTVASCWGPDGGWALRTSNTSLVYTDSSGATVSKSSAVALNSQYHLAVTVGADGAVTLYVNGASVATGTTTLPATTSTARLVAGSRWSGTAFVDNWISRLEYVDVTPSALTPAQIAAASTEALT